ncbi:MAG: AbgT family transporter [Symploca sp. SIO2C1]|nr:AbgT family transporter [Symploca sp. SIO2C1]
MVNNHKKNFISSILQRVENVGNRLPDPVTIFIVLCFIIIIVSAIASGMGVSVTHPATKETIEAVSILTPDGIRRIVSEAVSNFVSFPPLGTVLVAILGFGVAEYTGLLAAILRQGVLIAPAQLITPVIVFIGVMSNLGADAGYVILPPLAALVFLSFGKHPIAGLAAAFAGVAGGFSANFLVNSLDPLLAGITQSGAQLIDGNYTVDATANYYFMAVSTLVITFLGWWVTERIVAPQLGTYQPSETVNFSLETLTAEEKKGLRWAGYSLAALIGLLMALVLPAQGILRQPETFTIIPSPFLTGIVFIMTLVFLILGIAYGLGAGTIKTDKDAIQGMTSAMSGMGYYLVLSFFMAQFVAYFSWTNLGLIVAISGAEFLQGTGLTGILLLLGLIVLSGFINLFIGSASGKWAIMAPVFVPMLMLLDYSPELTQLVYRIGDSSTNMVTPLLPYFPIIVAYGQKYDKNFGLGTLIAMMLPYSVVFLLGWSILFILWLILGIPLGPGVSTYLS